MAIVHRLEMVDIENNDTQFMIVAECKCHCA